ncbi:MAG: hypothetical protein AAGE52_03700 [Myxococcota bacterium]
MDQRKSALARTMATVTILAGFASTAAADRVAAPPPDCPPGSAASFDGGGPHCRPLACASDADCEGTLRCAEASLCVLVEELRSYSQEVSTRESVTGTCASGAVCERGECQSRRWCVLGTPEPSEPSANPANGEQSANPATGEPSANPATGEPSANPAPGEPSNSTTAGTTASREDSSFCSAASSPTPPLWLAVLFLAYRRR